jgi:biotin carboxylase
MSKPAVLLVGGNDEVLRKAKKLGLWVMLFQHPDKLSSVQQELADELYPVDFTDWDAVESLIHRLSPQVGAVVSLTEAGLECASRVNDLLGLDGSSHAVIRLTRDKLAMREHLAVVDPDAVPAARLTERADLLSFGDRHGYPFIVKPVNATASFAVFRVAGPEQVDEVWATIESLRGTNTERSQFVFHIDDFLIEKYLDGLEYSVESFSFTGRHVIIAITEKFIEPVSFTEVGHVLPARIAPQDEEQIREVVARFLDHLGVRDGVGHTEVRLGTTGAAVIETHNRPGGDAIGDLVAGAYGIDLIEYTLGWPFRLVPELPDRPLPSGAASTRFLVSAITGVVESVADPAEALDQPDVLAVQLSVRPGDRVRQVQDNWDRLALVAATGATAEAALARSADVARTLSIQIKGRDGGRAAAVVAEVGEA